MKTAFLTIGLLAVLACKEKTAPSQNSVSMDSATVKKDTVIKNETAAIDAIKKEYSLLHAQQETNTFDSTGFTYSCHEERSGKVTFYSDQHEIKIIEHSYDEYSHFNATEKYFIKNGKVFFIFKKAIEWRFDGGTPEKPGTRDDITETRVYIRDDKPFRCMEKQYIIRSDASVNPSRDKIPSKEIPCSADDLMKTYRSLLKNKDKKGKIQCL